jgi:hypothetical protein
MDFPSTEILLPCFKRFYTKTLLLLLSKVMLLFAVLLTFLEYLFPPEVGSGIQ